MVDGNDDCSSSELTLSGGASEWLFYIKFWDKVNSECHTDFAQYEEETLASFMIGYVMCLLGKLRSDLVELRCDEIAFRYGWKQDMSELICTLSKKALIDELDKLASLLARAAKNDFDVYCQL
jgi:hypothetical protein